MKTLVLYRSQTGCTKKYAEDIAKAVGGDILPFNRKFKEKKLAEYDTVVYGGWIMGGKIQGIDDFLAMWDSMKEKNVIVFSSGMSIPTDEGRKEIISTNVLDLYHVRYYQLRGSFDMKKLKFPFNLAMKYSMLRIQNDPNASADQKAILMVKDTPIEAYDSAKVDYIISVIEKLGRQA